MQLDHDCPESVQLCLLKQLYKQVRRVCRCSKFNINLTYYQFSVDSYLDICMIIRSRLVGFRLVGSKRVKKTVYTSYECFPQFSPPPFSFGICALDLFFFYQLWTVFCTTTFSNSYPLSDRPSLGVQLGQILVAANWPDHRIRESERPAYVRSKSPQDIRVERATDVRSKSNTSGEIHLHMQGIFQLILVSIKARLVMTQKMLLQRHSTFHLI